MFIDFSNASLINTAIHNSEFFTIKNDKIIYNPNDNKKKLLEGIGVYFNAKIPYRVKNDFPEIMKEVNTELNPEYESVC
ncbi:hypothetical protein HY745_03010 [Candidatus Desantisbacteria bacterium]|nr:hypothetical protein [Candidatus Desantisbacteria bacterium]